MDIVAGIFAALEKILPEESQKLRKAIELDYSERYLRLKQRSEMEAVTLAEPEVPTGSDADADACTLADTPEHYGSGEACDDGRAGGK